MAEAMFPLQARGLTVRFGDHAAIRDVALTLGEACRVVVLGANGAGKSVLLRALHGLIRPSGGEVRWGDTPGRARSQAMVFQQPVMLRRSALANIEFALGVNGVPTRERRERARE